MYVVGTMNRITVKGKDGTEVLIPIQDTLVPDDISKQVKCISI